MSWNFFKTFFTIGVAALFFGVVMFSGVVRADWINPGTNPPAGNAPAPINVGGTDQFKSGGITICASSILTDAVNKLFLRSSGNIRAWIESTGAGSFAGLVTKTPNREYYQGVQTGGSGWYLVDNSAGASRIYVDSDGAVGINTTSPNVSLTVGGGSLRIIPRSVAPYTCNSSVQGAMYFDSSSVKHMLCNGSQWTEDRKSVV